MCRCSEEIAEPSLKKKSGSKPEYSFFPHRHFDSFFSVLRKINELVPYADELLSWYPGNKKTAGSAIRGPQGESWRLEAGLCPQADARVLSGQLSLGDTENTREILAIPDTAQLHSQRHRF